MDYAVLVRLLERRRMLPLVGGRLVGLAPEAVPAEFSRAVRTRLQRDRVGNMARQAQARAVVGALGARGIRALPLKGPGLAARVHGDIGLRSPGDVDLLVRREDLPAAVDVLRGEGYARPHDPVDRDGLPRLHFTMDHPELPTVELHWRVSWYEEDFSKDLLERARPAADGLLEPDPVDEAASLLLYYARDGFFGLRLAADLAAWCDRHAPPPGGGLLDGCARRYPQLARVWCAAAAALSRVSRIPATTWLTSPPRLGRRATLAVRLATWSQRGDEDQLRSNISLVDGLLTPPRSLDRFMIRLMTDDPEHVPSHVTKRMARFATGLWAVRREPWDPVPADV